MWYKIKRAAMFPRRPYKGTPGAAPSIGMYSSRWF